MAELKCTTCGTDTTIYSPRLGTVCEKCYEEEWKGEEERESRIAKDVEWLRAQLRSHTYNPQTMVWALDKVTAEVASTAFREVIAEVGYYD